MMRVLLLASWMLPSAAFADDPVRPPQAWAILISVTSPGDPIELKDAASNARELRNRLVEKLGWRGDHILLLDQSSNRNPTTVEAKTDVLGATDTNLDWAVKKWLGHNIRPGDLVLIYYAGRATVAEDGIGGHALLATRDSSKPWKLDAAIDSLASRSENPILILLDSPHPEAFNASLPKTRMPQSDQLLGILTRWPGVSAWLSGRPKPASSKSQASLFLEAFTQGLGSDENARNLIGCIDVLNRDPRLIASRFQVSGGVGLEWTLWPKRLAAIDPPPNVLLLHGHSDRVTTIVTSADGSRLITGSRDSTIKIWRSSDGALLRTLAPHLIGVTAMALSPDGTKLASGDGNGRIVLSSLDKLSPRTFSGRRPHDAGISAIAFVPDAPRFVSLDTNNQAVLWDATGPEPKPKPLATDAGAIACGEDRIAVAVRGEQPTGSILLFHPDGSPLPPIHGVAGKVVTGCLSVRGECLAYGDDLGNLEIHDLVTGRLRKRIQLGAAPLFVHVWPDGRVLAGHDQNLTLIPAEGSPINIPMPGPVASASISNDGKSFAASTHSGDLRAWTIEDGKPVPAVVDEGPKANRAVVTAFAPRGDRLYAGDQNGGIRSWDWPDAGAPSRIAPCRGKIESLAVSPDGATIVTIDRDRRARIMDLQEGRSLRPIPGKWVNAAFFADGKSVAITQPNGNLSVVDAATGKEAPTAFERPLNSKGVRSSWGFQLVATSPDGKKIAGASHQGPLACVWSSTGGALLKVFRDQLDAITSVAFAADSRHLVLGSLDGSVNVWDLESNADRPRWSLKVATAQKSGISAAAISFGTKKRIAAGRRDGLLVLWELLDDGTASMVELGNFEGEVRALAFSLDGKSLIAGGGDKTTRVWAIGGKAPFPAPTRLTPQHFERVNAIAAIPNSRAMVSASDDSTLRFWLPEAGKLLGTLTADADSGQWVAFMEDGRFDSSPGGEQQVGWTRGDRLFPFEQFADASRIYGLAKLWLAGENASVRSPITDAKLPAMAIEPLGKPQREEITINVRLGEEKASLAALRLYRNDMPIKDETDFQATADPRLLQVRVELAPGDNRLYAMGSRREVGSMQGRSNVVSIKLPGNAANAQGNLHILAIGISKYRDSPLEFARRDAESLAAFLRRNGYQSGAKIGYTKVLPDDEVSTEIVEAELMTLKDQARPEDTVVVFLAGHTDVRRDDRYCLLLPNFPLKPGQVGVNVRGPLDQPKGVPVVDNAATILPFTSIERILARTNVANRLVVIDACQAEAIFDDPGVRRIREKTVDAAAHKIRTSYLLASRRGEGAKEAAVLRHGVLTHLLLRGMGAPDLEPEPGGRLGNADLDEDGLVTSEELRGFIDMHLRDLSSRIENEAIRANPERLLNAKRPAPDVPRVGSATTSFPLAKLPPPNE